MRLFHTQAFNKKIKKVHSPLIFSFALIMVGVFVWFIFEIFLKKFLFFSLFLFAFSCHQAATPLETKQYF